MIALIQRIDSASCAVDNKTVSSIGKGLLVFVGIEKNDTENMLEKMSDKILTLRIFEDDQGKMNRSVLDDDLSILLIPNFTLSAVCDSRRPSFSNAKEKDVSEKMYENLFLLLKEKAQCQKGVFSAHMHIHAENSGPVNIIIKL
jgi:D-tyrosyl-tRNA(Tyr) deacylase